MAVLGNVLDSFAMVGEKVNFAHVFTGIGPDLRKLRHVMTSSKSKQSFAKPSRSSKICSLASPSIIGNCAEARVQQAHLREAEDDRWCQVEGGSPRRFRSCRTCAYLCAENEPVCEVCGTLAPVQDEENLQNENLEVPACLEAEEPKSQITLEEVSVVDAVAVDALESRAQPERITDTADKVEDDCASEAELIPGTLDDAPAAGTLVKVLYDDDLWYSAMVLVSQNTVIRVRFETGKQAEIDVAEHAVVSRAT